MDEFTTARRQKLAKALADHALDLLECADEISDGAFVPIPYTSPPMFVMIGDITALKALISYAEQEGIKGSESG